MNVIQRLTKPMHQFYKKRSVTLFHNVKLPVMVVMKRLTNISLSNLKILGALNSKYTNVYLEKQPTRSTKYSQR